jgi:hypothetical protein
VNDRDRLYLQHVLDAIEDAQAFTGDGRESFMSDRKTQHAVIRSSKSLERRSSNRAPIRLRVIRKCPGGRSRERATV